MSNTYIPTFSTFMGLRNTHPDLYYTVETHRKMLNAQEHLGSEFYDLLQEREHKYESV